MTADPAVLLKKENYNIRMTICKFSTKLKLFLTGTLEGVKNSLGYCVTSTLYFSNNNEGSNVT
jgi:hypothetical protein